MTNEEKIKRHDALELIRQKIGPCFGYMDILFANHPSDRQHAEYIRQIAEENKITLIEIKEIILGYLLVRRKIAFKTVEREIPKFEAFFAESLEDDYS